jgi:hypothetical protein
MSNNKFFSLLSHCPNHLNLEFTKKLRPEPICRCVFVFPSTRFLQCRHALVFFASKGSQSLAHSVTCNPVIPNRGAVKRCQGCRQIWSYCLCIEVLLHKVQPNCHFYPIRGAAKVFKGLKGAANQKRLKNTDVI